MHTSTERTAGHVVTGAEYDRQLTAQESDRRAREAFRQLVLQISRPGALLFDFGCGTGMDARFYAERDFTVAAYDVDRQMCEFFRTRCQDLIQAGRVSLEEGSYREFLARRSLQGGRSADLVTSNFAPLNLITDLRELFARFHELSAPNGRVLASVLNPYFLRNLKYPWWWRNLPTLIGAGHYSVPGALAPIVRRRLSNYAAQSQPYFTLEKVYRGLPAHAGCAPAGMPPSRGAWLRLTTCRYMFLLFAKR